jgi:1L-myo-inositol 1-phosphate cytidylyltransferase / CDP-L-myo-inositol myo-inositolphosphotransferase
MTRIVLNFAEAESAEFLVAGIPAAARAVREITIAALQHGGETSCVIVTGSDWTPSQWCRHELDRFGAGIVIITGAKPPEIPTDATFYVVGDKLVAAQDIVATLAGAGTPAEGIYTNAASLDTMRSGETMTSRLARLRSAGRVIVKRTGKAGDGPVSRWLNRPISQAISRLLLKYPGMTPFAATCGTIAIATAMALSLIFGGEAGVVWGALLFHATSVFDGVDGEIARATFQSSAEGARLDSLTDAATNIAFITGLSFNIAQRGHMVEGAIGFAAVALLGLGLFLLGQRAKSRGANYGFNAVKDRFNAKKSWLLTTIAQIAARDFFAFAFAVSALAGLAVEILMIFSCGAFIWFIVITTTLVRTRSDAG